MENISVPEFNWSNFIQATKMFISLWITEQTKHRLYKWYLYMLDYIAQNEVSYGRLPDVVTSTEDADGEGGS